jgi:hypothetical protein
METKVAIAGHIIPPGKMTIVKSGGILRFYTDVVEIDNTLELGKVYEFDYDAMTGETWLSPAPALTIPDKVYDFEQKTRGIIITTLRSLEGNNNVGVVYEGYKGQGRGNINF